MLLYPGNSEFQNFSVFRNSHEENPSCKMHYINVDRLFSESAYREIIEEMVAA